jgi:hypothetical protein
MAPIPRTANSLRAARTDAAERQLAFTGFRFYAINGWNDLFGVIMAPERAERGKGRLAAQELAGRSALSEAPRFGMSHDVNRPGFGPRQLDECKPRNRGGT